MYWQSNVRLHRALRNMLVRRVHGSSLHLCRPREARDPRALLCSHHPRLARQHRLQVRMVIGRERLMLLLRSDPLCRIAVLHRAIVRVPVPVRAIRLLRVRVLHDRHGVLARYGWAIVLHRHSRLRAELGLESRVVVGGRGCLMLPNRELGDSQVETRRKGYRRAAVLGAPARQLMTVIDTRPAHLPPSVSPPMKGTSQTTSISRMPMPTTTPFIASGTPPAAASTTMMTRSPSENFCPCRR